jgi:hypothetical protein
MSLNPLMCAAQRGQWAMPSRRLVCLACPPVCLCMLHVPAELRWVVHVLRGGG